MTVAGLLLAWLIGGVAFAVLGAVVFGLLTGRLNRRAEGCCPADPAKDLRMRGGPDQGSSSRRSGSLPEA